MALVRNAKLGRFSSRGELRRQASPPGSKGPVASEAVSVLATWITEDVKAVAGSFGAGPERLLADALEKLGAGAAFVDLRDAGGSRSGRSARRKRLGVSKARRNGTAALTAKPRRG